MGDGRAEPPVNGAAQWKPWLAWTAVVVTLGGVLASRLIVRGGGDPRIGVAVALVVFSLASVAVPILFAGVQGRPSASDFGLRRPPLRHAIGLTIAVLIATYALGAIWVTALGVDDESQNVVDRLAAGDATLNAVLVVVLLAVATPLAEEFLYRGYFLRAMCNWRGVAPAVLVTTVVFAATHAGWSPIGFLVPVALFGLALNLLYLWTGSLYPCLAMHSLINSFGAIEALEGWQVPVAILFSIGVTLAIARLIGVLLDERAAGARGGTAVGPEP